MIHSDSQGSGPTIVLLHGVGLDGGLWSRCVPALAADHRVVVPDLRGHGRSPAIEGRVTLAELAADVAEIMEGPAHVVGFSLGALVASELALSRDDLVERLTLVSCVADRSDREREAVRRRLSLSEEDFGAAVEAAIERWFDPEWGSREPELVEQVRATMLANHRDSYVAAYGVFAEADAELWGRLPSLRAPTLVVTGEEDAGSTPEMARRLAGEIPDAKAVVVPGARHLLPLQCPNELVRLILEHDRQAEDKEQGKEERSDGNDHAATLQALRSRRMD